MSEQIYRPFGKVLMRDDEDKPLACACKQCGRFALNTETQLCARCWTGRVLAQSSVEPYWSLRRSSER